MTVAQLLRLRMHFQPGLTAGLAAWHAATSSGGTAASAGVGSPTRSAPEASGTTRAAGKKGIEYVLFSPSWTAGSVATTVADGLVDASPGVRGKGPSGSPSAGAVTSRPGTSRVGLSPSSIGSSLPVGSVVPLLNDVFGEGPEVLTSRRRPDEGDESDMEDDERAFGTQAPPLISSLSRSANTQLQRIVEHGFGPSVSPFGRACIVPIH